jgi:hypothetical protein
MVKKVPASMEYKYLLACSNKFGVRTNMNASFKKSIYVLNNYFNIIFPTMIRTLTWHHTKFLHDKKKLKFKILFLAFLLNFSPLFELFISLFFSESSYSRPLKSKYSPVYTVFKCPHSFYSFRIKW